MKQTMDAIRIQLINWPMRYVFPVGLLGMVLLINLAIFGSIDVEDPATRITGAILSIYITAGVGYTVTVNQGFPFALGLSVTRRAFYRGTVLLALVDALAYGALMVVLSQVEQATAGWGVQVQFFALPWIRDHTLPAQWLIYAAPFLMLSLVFAFIGAVFKRWGQAGIWLLTLGSTVLIGGLVVLITWQEQWMTILRWLVAQPSTAILGLYPLVLAVLAGTAGWLIVRRATP